MERARTSTILLMINLAGRVPLIWRSEIEHLAQYGRCSRASTHESAIGSFCDLTV